MSLECDAVCLNKQGKVIMDLFLGFLYVYCELLATRKCP